LLKSVQDCDKKEKSDFLIVIYFDAVLRKNICSDIAPLPNSARV